jgi:hypothetical protein
MKMIFKEGVMKKVIVTGVLLISTQIAFAQEAHVFSDRDLEKYEKNSTATVELPTQDRSVPAARSEEREKASSESKKEYYCDNATKIKRDIVNAKEELEAANQITVRRHFMDQTLHTYWIDSKDDAAINRAKRKIEILEKKQAAFEQDAHSKRIPPGWLRCQW